MLHNNLLGPQGSLVDPLGFGSLRLRFKSGRTHFPALAQFGRALDCRSKCCWFKSGRRDFIYYLFRRILHFLGKQCIFPKYLYMMKFIVIDSVYEHDTTLVFLPWWCRGYHVGLSSPRLGFKSRPGRFKYNVVQKYHLGLQLSLAERLAFNQAAAGSIPVRPVLILYFKFSIWRKLI